MRYNGTALQMILQDRFPAYERFFNLHVYPARAGKVWARAQARVFGKTITVKIILSEREEREVML